PVGDFMAFMPPRHMAHTLPLLLVAVSASTSAGGEWTSFQNGGRPVDSTATSSESGTIAWSSTIPGTGQSSPVVRDGRIYLTSVSGPQKETYHVCGYSLADGAMLWQYDLANASPQESSSYVSHAAPTPVVDEHGVIAFFEGGNLVALSSEGVGRWERNLVEEYGPIDSRHGLGASLAQSSTTVFIWVERQSEPYVLAVDKSSGATRWKVPGAGATSWASPRLVPVAGGEHLVLSAIGTLIGIDPESGERLWTFNELSGNSTPTPMPYSEGKFLIGATVGREGGDATVAAASNGAVGIEQAADGSWQAKYVWHAKRATSSFGSPLGHDGLAYFVNRAGVLYGVELATGEERFAERIGSSLWATPLAAGERVYLPRKDGTVTVIASGPEYRVLNEIPLTGEEPRASEPAAGPPGADSGPTLYAAVLVDGQLIARFGDRLVCVQLD
ncbi:MAG: PQQ-binding-like beta-propeller repeat protein, partial [Planctomycetaceae bacterium]|nr:PQQ-binding-like beta-propeller repeat protein [Planctomycetaceae bacterium]